MKIYDLQQIQQSIDLNRDLKSLLEGQRQAFIDYSKGAIKMPLPLQMTFPSHQGDCHIKAGFQENDDIFIVKIATGFYQNAQFGLPPGDGIILVFSQQTGILKAILCDKGFLTTLRTALAAVVAAQITPWNIHNIGIMGTGQLAIQILDIMKYLYPTATFKLWGRSTQKTKEIACSYKDVEAIDSIEKFARNTDLIISTTASTKPIIQVEHIADNTHIIALGADDRHKQECDPRLFIRANTVIVDSRAQALQFGDTYHAIQDKIINIDQVMELGVILEQGVSPKSKLIITDLTGIAAQDLAISKFMMQMLNQFSFCND